MRGLERRIAALEAVKPPADPFRVIWLEAGETETDAMKRAGYPPDADVMWVRFVSPTDARL